MEGKSCLNESVTVLIDPHGGKRDLMWKRLERVTGHVQKSRPGGSQINWSRFWEALSQRASMSGEDVS